MRNHRFAAVTRQLARTVTILYVAQLLIGALNVALKAPVWMQLVHLLMTTLIWIGLVILAASALSERPQADATGS